MVKLEPVLDWASVYAGAKFLPAECVLGDVFVDAYLAATGESHPAYSQGFAPPLCLALVRFSKQSLGGRWPSGTLQLSQSFRSHRALRRGERISLALDIESVEEREGRRYFAVRTLAHDGHGDVVAEQRSNQIWAQDMGSVGAATAARSLRPAATTTRQQSEAATIGPLTDRYPMSRVRAYGELAGAMDPIHLDPKFAQATGLGMNIAQGKLVMTLLHRLILDHFGMPWLERGSLDIRFRRPVLVDQPIQAWARPIAGVGPRACEVWCVNPGGERIIVGQASIAG